MRFRLEITGAAMLALGCSSLLGLDEFHAGDAGTDGGTSGASGAAGGGQGGASGGASGGSGGSECSTGAKECLGLLPRECVGGRWKTSATECPFLCKGGTCDGECKPDATECAGQEFRFCRADYLWERTQCPLVCDSIDGCVGSCLPDTYRCNGAVGLERCNSDGEYMSHQVCAHECAYVSGTARCVACASGDSRCPKGCDPSSDADCPMNSCPNIYLGPDYAHAPPTPFWENDAIDTPTTLSVGLEVTINITVRNHGTDDSPYTKLELYWADPTDGYTAIGTRLIGEVFTLIVPGGIALPPADGESVLSFTWTPDSSVLAVNGGQVALVARLDNLSPPAKPSCPQQFYGSGEVGLDPRIGIRHVSVVAGD